jgi:hypothetical protein
VSDNPWLLGHVPPELNLKDFELFAEDNQLVGRILESEHDGKVGYLRVNVNRRARSDKELIVPAGMVTNVDQQKRQVRIGRKRDEVMELAFDSSGGSMKRSTALTDTPGSSFS